MHRLQRIMSLQEKIAQVSGHTRVGTDDQRSHTGGNKRPAVTHRRDCGSAVTHGADRRPAVTHGRDGRPAVIHGWDRRPAVTQRAKQTTSGHTRVGTDDQRLHKGRNRRPAVTYRRDGGPAVTHGAGERPAVTHGMGQRTSGDACCLGGWWAL